MTVTDDNRDTHVISVVVPCFNEALALPQFHARLMDVINVLDMDYEIIYVNDGSGDSTLQVLQTLQRSTPGTGVIDLSRNFGKEAAMSAGIDHASGDAVVIIDADLQDPPELIPRLIAGWREGHDVVYATRSSRKGEHVIKRWTAKLFYRTMSHVGDAPIPPDAGDFRLLSRRAVDALRQLPETQRFMKGLFTWIGFSQTSVSFSRDARQAGVTTWSYRKLWNLAIEGITSFTTAPLRLSIYLGLLTAVGAFIYGGVVVVDTLIYGNEVKGYPSLMVVILMLGGIQMITLGILGEYLGRLFMESKRRPLYLVNAFHKPRPTSGSSDG